MLAAGFGSATTSARCISASRLHLPTLDADPFSSCRHWSEKLARECACVMYCSTRRPAPVSSSIVAALGGCQLGSGAADSAVASRFADSSFGSDAGPLGLLATPGSLARPALG